MAQTLCYISTLKPLHHLFRERPLLIISYSGHGRYPTFQHPHGPQLSSFFSPSAVPGLVNEESADLRCGLPLSTWCGGDTLHWGKWESRRQSRLEVFEGQSDKVSKSDESRISSPNTPWDCHICLQPPKPPQLIRIHGVFGKDVT